MSVIAVNGLTKDYGGGKGIFDLSFDIPQGEVFGYLGPNGSGKTTTIRHLLGFLNADAGSCTINGLNCRQEAKEIQRTLGYLPGEIVFFDEMTGIKYLHFIAELRGIKNLDHMRKLIDEFELDPSGRIKKMSKGMKQKLGIVSAFMCDPQVLVLDEPTSGLDPLMQNRFVELILREKAAGKTILMSSHSFEEVERTCDRVGIIKEGRFVTVQTVENLKKSQRKCYLITFDTAAAAEAFSGEPLDIKPVDSTRLRVTVHNNLPQFTAALARHPISGIDSMFQSLEEVFMSYYGKE